MKEKQLWWIYYHILDDYISEVVYKDFYDDSIFTDLTQLIIIDSIQNVLKSEKPIQLLQDSFQQIIKGDSYILPIEKKDDNIKKSSDDKNKELHKFLDKSKRKYERNISEIAIPNPTEINNKFVEQEKEYWKVKFNLLKNSLFRIWKLYFKNLNWKMKYLSLHFLIMGIF